MFNNSLTDQQNEVDSCPDDEPRQQCGGDPCNGRSCRAYPGIPLTCKVNNCGGSCTAEFYDEDNEKVSCCPRNRGKT